MPTDREKELRDKAVILLSILTFCVLITAFVVAMVLNHFFGPRIWS